MKIKILRIRQLKLNIIRENTLIINLKQLL